MDDSRVSVRGILASLALCMLLPSLGISIANVALPTLVTVFDAPFQHVQWVVIAYLLANTASLVIVGRLGDVVGRKHLLLGGIALFAAASVLCGASTSVAMLIAARTAQGLGAAVMLALAMAFVGEAVPKARAGSAMGLLGTMSAIGTALGPSLGGFLIAALGWRAIFLVLVPLGMAAFALAWRYLPVSPRAAQRQSAFGGAGALLRDPALRASLAMSALVSTVLMATLVVGPFHLAHSLGLGMAVVGLVMSAGPAVAALSGVPAGRAVDHFGTQRTTAAGLAGIVVGCVGLSIAPAALGIAGFVIPIVIVTASYALFQAANNTGVMTGVAADQRGVVSGLLNLSRNLGLVAGASMMGAVFAAFGMGVTFAAGAALAASALALALASGRAPALPAPRR